MSSDAVVVPVVAACIVQGERVLLCRRLVGEEPSTLGKWEFPGGVVHLGEKLEDAVKREILEELRFGVIARGIIHAQINAYDSGTDYLVIFFKCDLVSEVIHLADYIVWVRPQSIVEGAWDVLPGTVEAAKILLAGGL